jgi:SNF2 family DNA or RNA helicase
MPLLQKQQYRAIYEKNVKLLAVETSNDLRAPNLNNIAMELRKCCNHPFLISGGEHKLKETLHERGEMLNEGELLSEASAKFKLLDKLLPKLKSEGHRVLIFSQFVIMLDILEDYLRVHDFGYCRIDGKITGTRRQAEIDRFQRNKLNQEPPFAMLLSTRAGGVGINLTAADTVIIYDSDWNPQNDLQAQARCHRIGQTKPVSIYRLLTRNTYEEKMFHDASIKMGLDEVVLHKVTKEQGENNDAPLTSKDVERLLKVGAMGVFNEEGDEER